MEDRNSFKGKENIQKGSTTKPNKEPNATSPSIKKRKKERKKKDLLSCLQK